MSVSLTRQKFITAIGQEYLRCIVPGLMAKAFEAYKKRDWNKKWLQVSTWEHTHSTAAIILAVIGLEAFRNISFAATPLRRDRDTVTDLCHLLSKREEPGETSSPIVTELPSILAEVFVIRNVIAHNYLYDVDATFNQKWEMVKYQAVLRKGYGDKKFRENLGLTGDRTQRLRLNVQPLLIGFEDLFKVLLVLDTYFALVEKTLGYRPMHLHLLPELGDCRAEKLSDILTYYYDRLPHPQFCNELEIVANQLYMKFQAFLPEGTDYFVTNRCPLCSSLGFSKVDHTVYCRKCDIGIGKGVAHRPLEGE